MPRVLDMPPCDRYTWRDNNGHFDCWYQLSERFNGEELDKAFQLLEQADNLGSIMKFEICDDTRNYMKHCIQCYEDVPAHTESTLYGRWKHERYALAICKGGVRGREG